MAHHDVGTLVVLEESKVVGIITDRDLVIRVLAQDANPQTLALRTVMTSNLTCVPEDTPLEYALSRIRSHQIRRLVVVDEAQELVGIFALDDMLELLGEELQTIAGLMRAARGH
jgi:CBS domain-containing protein